MASKQKFEVRFIRPDGLISLAYARSLELARKVAAQPNALDDRYEIVLNGHMVSFGRYGKINGRAAWQEA
jgi:hypothetical protein